MSEKRYDVVVTYGTFNPKLPFASDCSKMDAEALKLTAVSKGYTDAEVIEHVKRFYNTA